MMTLYQKHEYKSSLEGYHQGKYNVYFTLKITKLFMAKAIEHSFYSVMNKAVSYLFSLCIRLHMHSSNKVHSFLSHLKVLLIDRRVYVYALNPVKTTSI